MKELAAHQAQLTDHTAKIKVGDCSANQLLLQVCFGTLQARMKRCHDLPLHVDWVSASELHELPAMRSTPTCCYLIMQPLHAKAPAFKHSALCSLQQPFTFQCLLAAH